MSQEIPLSKFASFTGPPVRHLLSYPSSEQRSPTSQLAEMAECDDFWQSPIGTASSVAANAAMAPHRHLSDKRTDKVMDQVERVKDKVVGRFISEKDFNRALAHYFRPSAAREEAAAVASFRDADILAIRMD